MMADPPQPLSPVQLLASQSKQASRALARASSEAKNRVLKRLGTLLGERKELLLAANHEDLVGAKGLSAAMLDRLTLSEARLAELISSVEQVRALPDPVGEVTRMWLRPNGMQVGQVRIPLGVIALIYESRPNVTIEASSLCFKSGNACILRGGSEALRSNRALAETFQLALEQEGLDRHAVQLLGSSSRQEMQELIALPEYVDLVIPRGGEGLIRFVTEHARVPVIQHYKGVCHLFVDASADPQMALEIIENAKTQRPGVCNALETLLIHRQIAPSFLPALEQRLSQVELRGDELVCQAIARAKPATEQDWSSEYLDLILSVRVVDSLEAAIEHIERYGSQHTEAIVTGSYENSQRFLREVNSSCVLVNASTRFNDGGQLGLGAEIGISTSKLHAYGPMGLTELTAKKFVVYGQGQVRQ